MRMLPVELPPINTVNILHLPTNGLNDVVGITNNCILTYSNTRRLPFRSGGAGGHRTRHNNIAAPRHSLPALVVRGLLQATEAPATFQRTVPAHASYS